MIYIGCTTAGNNGVAWCATSYSGDSQDVNLYGNCAQGCHKQGISRTIHSNTFMMNTISNIFFDILCLDFDIECHIDLPCATGYECKHGTCVQGKILCAIIMV